MSRSRAMPRVVAVLALVALAGCEWIGGPEAPTLVDPGAPDAGPGGPATLTFEPRGNGAGHVTLTPAGGDAVDCVSPGPACQLVVPPGTSVELHAEPALGSAVGLWTGVSGCAGGTCDVTVRGDLSVSVGLRLPVALAFVSSTVRAPGALGGRAAADAACVTLAHAAGYDGTFVALLGDPAAPAQMKPGHGWARSDGAVVTVTRNDAANGSIVVPLDRDELGVRVDEDARVVTELTTDLRLRDGDHCAGYALESGLIGYGRASGTARSWIAEGTMGCDEPAHLYCVQTDATMDPHPPVPPAAGELRAFYYGFDNQAGTSGFVPHGSRATADATCQAYATRVLGSDTPWIALLATQNESPTTRLPDDQVWKRVDGPVLGTSAELKGGHMRVPLNVMPDGIPASTAFYYLGGFEPYARVWIGAPSLAELGTTLSACTDWSTDTSAALTAPISDGRSTFELFENCTAGRGLWCVELPKP